MARMQQAHGEFRNNATKLPVPLPSLFLLDHMEDPTLRQHYRVMVDLDQTIFPLLKAMAERPGGEMLRHKQMKTYGDLPGLIEGGMPRMLRMFDEVMSLDAMLHHPPIPGAGASLRALRAHGCELYVKTDRPESFTEATRRYLEFYAVPFDSLVCAPGLDKLAECLEDDIGIVVDDHPDFAVRALQAGLDAFSLHYQYLDEAVVTHGLRTAASWPHLAQLVMDAIECRISAQLSSTRAARGAERAAVSAA